MPAPVKIVMCKLIRNLQDHTSIIGKLEIIPKLTWNSEVLFCRLLVHCDRREDDLSSSSEPRQRHLALFPEHSVIRHPLGAVDWSSVLEAMFGTRYELIAIQFASYRVLVRLFAVWKLLRLLVISLCWQIEAKRWFGTFFILASN